MNLHDTSTIFFQINMNNFIQNLSFHCHHNLHYHFHHHHGYLFLMNPHIKFKTYIRIHMQINMFTNDSDEREWIYSKNCDKFYLQFFLHWDCDNDLPFTAYFIKRSHNTLLWFVKYIHNSCKLYIYGL